MQTRALATDRAVSPVIGVILMVAITVILAAVIGAFALGLGDTVDTTPRATFDYETTELSGQPDELRITHTSGDTIDNRNLYVTGSAGVQDEDGTPGPSPRLRWADIAQDNGAAVGDRVRAGDSVLVEPPDADPELADKTFRVVWVGENEERSVTLSVWRGEDVT